MVTIEIKKKQDAELFGEFLAEYLDENVTSLGKELFDVQNNVRKQIQGEGTEMTQEETEIEEEEEEEEDTDEEDDSEE